ncbi:chorismate binding enzyme [Leucobacter chromiiresistens]|uniref:Chorismate binding enzyme n=2 Tax=Leucobacter chromiiresistens TaxID=1079994 RepID=A0A1H1A550_9MICO|nr:chorismate binding enzyme [Leucobacter chromiiresistens]
MPAQVTRPVPPLGPGAEVVAAELARRFSADGAPWFWWDGGGAAAGEERVSILGIASEVRRAAPGEEHEFLERMRRESGAVAADEAHGGASGAFPQRRGFGGGWAIALAYEFGAALLGIAPDPAPGFAPGPVLGVARDPAPGVAPDPEPHPGFAPDVASPVAVALRCEVVVAVDHDANAVELRGPSREAIDAWLDRHGRHLRPVAAEGVAEPESAPARRHDPGDAPRWRRSDAEYAEAVEQCRAAIRAGEAYVLCLTDTAEVPGACDPVEIYERLRAAGPPMRGGILDAGSHALVSASPERFLSVRGRRVATHPIKGTRRRGGSGRADRELAARLAADPKERAENLMIVDLMRNDLSRVCEPGSVRVDRFLDVETHPHVLQLVSTVSGALARGAGVWDAIAAAFPGGSMTGAPKRRAVELLQRIEGGPRGFYSGCFGWIDRGGDAELAMTIRTVELHRGDRPVARAAAGGGITIDSVAASEVSEKHVKAAALLEALCCSAR